MIFTSSMAYEWILAATGIYESYTGGAAKEFDRTAASDLLSVETIMLKPAEQPQQPNKTVNADKDNSTQATSFLVIGEGGYYFPITDVNGTQIGQKFKNILVDEQDLSMLDAEILSYLECCSSDNQMGINQGYSYQFPKESFIVDLGRITCHLETGDLFWMMGQLLL